jgi:hypothetical protein
MAGYSSTKTQFKKLLKEQFRDTVARLAEQDRPAYEPTGLQEDIIYTVGCGKFKIVVALDCNRAGKSSAIMNIAKNILWAFDPKWFGWWEGDNVFKKWPYPEKSFRIMGTPSAVADNGSIVTELRKWWPRGKYTLDKGGKSYYSQISTDSGWIGDMMTYEQSREEYEGKTLSLGLADEPPKPALMGAIMSRLMQGVLIVGATPINCGIFLDVLDDIEEKGAKIARVSGTVWQNDKDTGKPNHLGTKRGLWTAQEIAEYAAAIPPDERESRLEGKATNKSGKIYPMFDNSFPHDARHVKNIDVAGGYLKNCNCYMAIDPHRKYYPFIKWYAVTPNNEVIVYNEFPSRKYLGGMYYDEIRNSKQFDLSMEQLAAIIKACDFSEYGAKIISRIPDPRFSAENAEFMTELGRWGITNWRVPARERIETQRVRLQQLMTYDTQRPFNEFNKMSWYVAPWCENSRRAYERHFWLERKPGVGNSDGVESEDYKDPIDDDRYFLSVVDINYQRMYENSETNKKRQIVSEIQRAYFEHMPETSIAG